MENENDYTGILLSNFSGSKKILIKKKNENCNYIELNGEYWSYRRKKTVSFGLLENHYFEDYCFYLSDIQYIHIKEITPNNHVI